jgi:hypothetical protein
MCKKKWQDSYRIEFTVSCDRVGIAVKSIECLILGSCVCSGTWYTSTTHVCSMVLTTGLSDPLLL